MNMKDTLYRNLSKAKTKNMSRKETNFAFETPYLYGNHNEKIELYIDGVGYWDGGKDEDSIWFDVNEVSTNEVNTTVVNFQVKIKTDFTPLYRALAADEDSRFIDHIHNAIVGHLQGLFHGYEGEHTTTDNVQETPVQSLENGNFSSDNLFAAIGDICRSHNEKIING